MNNMTLRRTAPRSERSANQQMHPSVVEACLTTFGNEQTETQWEEPTADEWRRAVMVIAKQVALRFAGYRDHDEFARDGWLVALDVFETRDLSTRRDH